MPLTDRAPFAEVLARLMHEKGYSLNRLAADSNISKSVLHRWTNDQIRRPHTWQPLLRVARTLNLDRAETNALLAAARHLPIDQLVGQAQTTEDKEILSRWTGAGLNNLPGSVTSFVGREEEIATLKGLLQRHRLVTLTGPGGSGKTRLAQRVAEAAAHTFADGVYFVGLAPITDPALVVPTIGRVLGIPEAPSHESLQERLRKHLRESRSLLLLDNFERVAEAAGDIGELLSATRSLKVLVTSRVRLHLQGEQLFPVEPLPLPAQTSGLVALTANHAVRLFADRGQLVDHRFKLTAGNVHVVAEICRRLDGLPLAIELAAARVRYISPQQLLARFPSGLEMATGGARDVPRRQQTLRGMISWSYDLLRLEEQRLFRRLAVFAGGCPEDAAMEVCVLSGEAALDVSAGLDSLVENNLLRQTPGVDDEARFEMLETIREYALERLEESGDLEATLHRHADHYLRLAETAAPEFDGARQTYWLNRLDLEHDNFRAALRWCKEQGEVVRGLRLSTALMSLWQLHEHHVEGRGWLQTFATEDCEAPRSLRAKALLWQGLLLVRHVGDFVAAAPLFDQALALYRESGDLSRVCETLQAQGDVAFNQGEFWTARDRFTQSLHLAQQVGDSYLTARAYMKIARCAQEDDDFETAQHCWERALEMAREAGNQARIALALNGLGEVARYRRDLERAECYYEQGLELARELDSEWGITMSLQNLGYIACYRGEYERAAELFSESLSLHEKRWVKRGIGECLAGLAYTATRQGQLERSARLCGAAEALLGSNGARLDTLERADYEQTLCTVRSKLPDERSEALIAEGRAMSLERAIELATNG